MVDMHTTMDRLKRAMADKPDARQVTLNRSTVEAMLAALDEVEFTSHEEIVSMLTVMRDTVLPLLRRNAEDLLRCVSVSVDPATISGQDWRDVADDLEAVLAVERFVGRPDDEYGRVLNPVLDAASWRAHL